MNTTKLDKREPVVEPAKVGKHQDTPDPKSGLVVEGRKGTPTKLLEGL